MAPPPVDYGYPPAPKPRPNVIPVRGTVGQTWRLLVDAPRQVMLPSLVVQLPVTAALAAVTAILFLTRFNEEPFLLVNEIGSETHRGLAFALVAIAAIQVLFSQVARAATVVAVAAVASGQQKSLAETLDPAFSRMGALIAQFVLVMSTAVLLVLSVIGVVLMPYVLARFAVSTEVMMLEEQRPLQSLVGSWRLLSGKLLRLLGVILLTVAICIGPVFLFSILNVAVTGSRTQQVVMSSVVTVVQALLLTPVFALVTAAVTLFYLKAREIDRVRRPA
jgi:hypothetical protein